MESEMKKILGLFFVIIVALPNVVRAENIYDRVIVNKKKLQPLPGAATIFNRRANEIINKLKPPNNTFLSPIKKESMPTYAPGMKPGSPSFINKKNYLSKVKGARPHAYGSFGIPYTETSVQLGPTNQSMQASGAAFLSTTAPYRTIGKLFVLSGGGWCTATLIRRSVIVTAAHCMSEFGNNSNDYRDWIFYPAYYGAGTASITQQEPYGSWIWEAAVWPNSWKNGTDPGEGAARSNDLAVIVLAKNVKGQFIGDITGWMGYAWNNYSFVSSPKTGYLPVATTTTLGYPALLDFGQVMQRLDGPSYTTSINGAYQIWQGSNYTGGSSGGPWIVNFSAINPILSGGAVVGQEPKTAVIGVTSWGSSDPNDNKDNYSSQFRQNPEYPNVDYGGYGGGNIGALIDTICNTIPSGYHSSYAVMGYCDGS